MMKENAVSGDDERLDPSHKLFLWSRSRPVLCTGLVLSGLLALFLFFWPPFHLVNEINRNQVDVPYADDWAFYGRLAQYQSGEISLSKFLSLQHNEARPVTWRLLMLLIYAGGRRAFSYSIVANVIAAVLTAAILQWLLWKTSRAAPLAVAVLGSILINFCLFSSAQWANWSSHSQLIALLPNLLLALAWSINISRFGPVTRTVGVGLCCWASSFCYANGLLQWILVPPLLEKPFSKRQRFILGGHLISAAACFLVYFWDWKRPLHHSAVAPGGALRIVRYFLIWIGSSYSSGSQSLAIFAGVLLLISLIATGIALMPFAATKANRHNLAPWVSFAIYALCSGSLAAWGRSHIGLEQALRSRYTSISLWISVALIGLVAVYFQRHSVIRRPRDFTFPVTLVGILSLMLVLAGRHQEWAELQWNQRAESLHFQRLALTTERFSKGQEWTFDAHPGAPKLSLQKVVLRRVNLFESQGYMHPNRVLEPALKSALVQNGRASSGAVAAVERTYKDIMRVCGWTTNPFRGFSVEHLRVAGFLHGSDGKFRLVAEGPLLKRRHDVERAQKQRQIYDFDIVGPPHLPDPKPLIPSQSLPAGNYNFLAIVYRDDLTEFAPVAPAELFVIP
jgi:hypothetical protein